MLMLGRKDVPHPADTRRGINLDDARRGARTRPAIAIVLWGFSGLFSVMMPMPSFTWVRTELSAILGSLALCRFGGGFLLKKIL